MIESTYPDYLIEADSINIYLIYLLEKSLLGIAKVMERSRRVLLTLLLLLYYLNLTLHSHIHFHLQIYLHSLTIFVLL